MSYTQPPQKDSVDAILQREKVRGDHIRTKSDQEWALEAQNHPDDTKAALPPASLFTRIGLWFRLIFKGY